MENTPQVKSYYWATQTLGWWGNFALLRIETPSVQTNWPNVCNFITIETSSIPKMTRGPRTLLPTCTIIVQCSFWIQSISLVGLLVWTKSITRLLLIGYFSATAERVLSASSTVKAASSKLISSRANSGGICATKRIKISLKRDGAYGSDIYLRGTLKSRSANRE